jgi:aarF domain-containing kinase
MPPGPAYNTLAVLYSLARILEHAAQNKASTAAWALGATESLLNRPSGSAASQQRPSAPTASSFDASTPEPSSSHSAPTIGTVKAPPAPGPTKAERRRIRQQLEEEEFRAILGKRWVDGVLVDGSLPFSTTREDATVHPAPLSPAKQLVEEVLIGVVSSESVPIQAVPEPTYGSSVKQVNPSVPANEAPSVEVQATTRYTAPLEPSHCAVSTPPPPSSQFSTPYAGTENLDTNPEPLEFVDSSPPPASTIPFKKTLTASKVPSSRIGRLFHYGGPSSRLVHNDSFLTLRQV